MTGSLKEKTKRNVDKMNQREREEAKEGRGAAE